MKNFATSYLLATKHNLYREDITVTELTTIPNLPTNVQDDIIRNKHHITTLTKLREADRISALERLSLISKQLRVIVDET